MVDAGLFRFQGSLDPRAQEFIPTNPYARTGLPLVQPHIYYPYPSLPYPSPTSEVQVMPFCETPPGWSCYPAPPAYVQADPPLPPPLPPPSPTPSRTLLLSSVPTDVSESTVRRELEAFGDVRAVQMERVREGVVTVHFYDLRQAQAALVEIQEQHMLQQCRLRRHFDAFLALNSAYNPINSVPPPPPPPAPARGLIAGRAVWAQFTFPSFAGLPEGNNQGSLVIFNLDPSITAARLREIFEPFGRVKELRETPFKRQQRFVEFYDVRDAAAAMRELNGKEIHGNHVIVQFSRAGGGLKRFSNTHYHHKFNHKSDNYASSGTPRSLLTPPPLSPPTPPPPGRSTISKPPRFWDQQIPSSGNKLVPCKGVETSIESLCDRISGIGKKNSKKPSNAPPVASKAQQQEQSSRSNNHRPWKGSRHGKEYDPRFLINEEAITESNCRDSRTTVMIKNIPNKYSQKLLLNMLDNHCIHCNEQIADGDDDQPLSSYDFVYLPIDFMNKCNVGYGFVNMTSPEATWRLYKAFHLRSWEVFNSKKICEVTYARLQGVDALKEHFKNSKFPCETEDYMPVVFSPPRDGRRLTDPVPIFGRRSPPAKVSAADGGEMDGGDLVEQEGGAVMENGHHPNHDHNVVDVNRNYGDGDDDGDVGGGSSRNGGDSDDEDDDERKDS